MAYLKWEIKDTYSKRTHSQATLVGYARNEFNHMRQQATDRIFVLKQGDSLYAQSQSRQLPYFDQGTYLVGAVVVGRMGDYLIKSLELLERLGF